MTRNNSEDHEYCLEKRYYLEKRKQGTRFSISCFVAYMTFVLLSAFFAGPPLPLQLMSEVSALMAAPFALCCLIMGIRAMYWDWRRRAKGGVIATAAVLSIIIVLLFFQVIPTLAPTLIPTLV